MSSIQRRPNGSYRARYRDREGNERARHFKRRVDAQAFLDDITASLVTGTYVSPQSGRISLGDFYDTWSERQVWATTTRKAMDLAVRSAPFADKHLADIKRSDLELWVKQMVSGTGPFSRPLAASTVHTRVNNLRAVLRAAHGDRLIASDPSAGLRLPRRRKTEAAMRLPTSEEVGRLMLSAEPEFVCFVALCAFAGLRLGEAAAVRVSDVDFLRRTLTVSRQVQRAGGQQVEISPPKYGSERTVFLAPRLVELLAAHVAEHVRGEWLFTGSGPLPPHQNTVGHRWRSTAGRAGLTDIRLHDLRHFFASGLIASGCDVVTVQRALGHSKATTTLATYAHLWPSAEDRTRSAAEAMFEQALTPVTTRTIL